MKTTTSTQYFSNVRAWRVRLLAGLFAAATTLGMLPSPAHAGVFIGVGVTVGVPPPMLPVYVQPPIPAPGYIWTPGYWAWNGAEYYWVPGTWILPPYYGALWTPGYWGWVGGVYAFHAGYWGTHVGFYGGVNYGFGYTGVGYLGGHWGPGGFFYNRTVNQFGGVHVTNVYNQTIVHNTFVNRTSYNGGRGGLTMHATAQQMAFARDPHNVGPIAAQQAQMHAASQNRAMFASVNHGSPAIAASQRPGVFNGAGVTAAHGAAAAGRAPQAGNMALRSANFAPHANAAARPGGFNGNAAVNRSNYSAHTQNAYHPAGNAYHPAPSYRAAPQYHAAQYRPAAAPRGGSYAPRGGSGGGRPAGGGGHDARHG